jgi:hypothetical protein
MTAKNEAIEAEMEAEAVTAAKKLGGGWRWISVPGMGRVGWEVVLVSYEAKRLIERMETTV